MNRAVLAALIVVAPLTFGACSQLLAYDDYRERPLDGSVDSGAVVTDSFVGETNDAEPGPARPPARPAGSQTPSGSGKTLWVAVKRMYVGSQTSLGMNSPTAWREFGFDLDSICTSQEDSIKNVGTCRRHAEANQDFLVDGDGCRDNNFGHHVVPLLVVSSEGFEQRLNEGIFEGSNTWLIRIDDLDDGPDDAYAPAKLYRAASAKGGGLKWDGTDVRKVLSDSVVDRDLNKPIADFSGGYVKDNVWVSGDPAVRQIVLPVSDVLFVTMNLEAALFTLALDAGHKSATRGHLGGAIPMRSIEELLSPIATSSGFCKGTSLYNSLLRNVQRFPDVVIGAPNLQDTTQECDGMSIGLAFDVTTVQPVTEVVDPPPGKPDPCTDAGPPDTGPPDSGAAKSDAKTDGG
jgi:hypothetical protein